VTGCLVTAPLLLSIARDGGFRSVAKPWILGVFAAASLALIVAVLGTSPGRDFIVTLFLIPLAATMLGSTRLVHLVTGLIAAAAVAVTYLWTGPFNLGSSNDNLVHLQIYLVTLAVTSVALIELRAKGSMRIVAVTLTIGWILCGMLAASFRQASLASDDRRFKMEVRDAELRIALRLTRYIEGLNGGVGLFEASDAVELEEWRVFARRIDFPNRLPGIRGVGTISRVKADELDRYLDQQRRSGNDFVIKQIKSHPVAKTPEHYIIDMIEPRTGNDSAVGVDIASETNRRHAAELARDTGEAAMTGPVQLVQDSRPRPGFLLLVPRYAKGATPTDPLTRSKTLVGWIYAPIVASEFFSAALDSVASPGQVELTVLDGEGALDAGAETTRFTADSSSGVVPLFSTDPGLSSRSDSYETTLTLAQRRLRALWRKGRTFASTTDSTHAWALGAGALISLLVASIFVALDALKARAESLAEQRMAALEQQRAAAANASRLASLGVMAGGIAHEINTPLAVIHGRAHILMESLASGRSDPAKLKASLEVIQATVMRISRVIKGLNCFARSGERDPMTIADLRTIVDDALLLCAERSKSHGVELLVEPAPSLALRCRPVQITQVLVNLLSNAFDAVAASAVKRVHVGIEVFDDRIELAVVDSGPGIPPDIRSKIMEPFFTTKDVGQGTGLGLSISKGLMEDHGGRLALDQASSTTRFVMTLPRFIESTVSI
jgi:signal transduction histidine kinase